MLSMCAAVCRFVPVACVNIDSPPASAMVYSFGEHTTVSATSGSLRTLRIRHFQLHNEDIYVHPDGGLLCTSFICVKILHESVSSREIMKTMMPLRCFLTHHRLKCHHSLAFLKI